MDIINLKGIGDKRIKYLNGCGINTTGDLVEFLPCSYKDMRKYIPVNECDAGTQNLIKAVVISDPAVNYIRKNFAFCTVKLKDGDGTEFMAQWYNQPYVKSRLKKGSEYLFFGVVSSKRGKKLVNPVFEPVNSVKRLKGIMPVYRKIEGINGALMKDLISQAIDLYKDEPYIPDELAAKYKITDLGTAYRIMHNPKSYEELDAANRSVSVSELCKIMYAYKQVKKSAYGNRKNNYSDNTAKLNGLISKLPYELSDSQKKAVGDILSDLNKNTTMNRMIAGDVGSGKTIVALITLYNAVLSGYQAALMAPTEVLARQHYKNAVKLLSPLGVRIKYYSSSLAKSDKDSILFDIRNGYADIIIGTHALIQPNVAYNKLALVITDELHRFGVSQRNMLENKGDTDVLVMSATPLPRTLALIFYSDLDVSYLEYPKSRADKITTNFVPPDKIDDMYMFIKKLGENNQQTYIICPRIEDDEENEDIISAVGLYKKLKKSVYKDIPVGLLHGRMKEEEKQAAVNKFNNGEFKILVSTTVVEVGIDVKDASVIAVFGAERYGLGQLHQLRGRVGRGEHKSYCFLITDSQNADTLKRLNILKNCNDGFALSDYDLSLRGAGDFIGERQSGAGDLFFMLNLDKNIIESARKLLDELENYQSASEILHRLAFEKYGDTILKVTLN